MEARDRLVSLIDAPYVPNWTTVLTVLQQNKSSESISNRGLTEEMNQHSLTYNLWRFVLSIYLQWGCAAYRHNRPGTKKTFIMTGSRRLYFDMAGIQEDYLQYLLHANPSFGS